MSPGEERQVIREELDKDKETYLDWFGKYTRIPNTTKNCLTYLANK